MRRWKGVFSFCGDLFDILASLDDVIPSIANAEIEIGDIFLRCYTVFENKWRKHLVVVLLFLVVMVGSDELVSSFAKWFKSFVLCRQRVLKVFVALLKCFHVIEGRLQVQWEEKRVWKRCWGLKSNNRILHPSRKTRERLRVTTKLRRFDPPPCWKSASRMSALRNRLSLASLEAVLSALRPVVGPFHGLLCSSVICWPRRSTSRNWMNKSIVYVHQCINNDRTHSSWWARISSHKSWWFFKNNSAVATSRAASPALSFSFTSATQVNCSTRKNQWVVSFQTIWFKNKNNKNISYQALGLL